MISGILITLVLLTNLLCLGCATEANTHRQKRTSSVRATLAEKLDPNFWPTRGRRSEPESEQNLQTILQFIKNHRFKATNREDRGTPNDDGPFWANRGRDLDEEWNTNQLSLTDTGEEPFWANRGRDIEYDDSPFWANRGRAINSGEEGPFWANRGRRENKADNTKLHHNPLFVEEPNWLVLSRRQAPQLESSVQDPFWVTRGKREFWPSHLKKDAQEMARALKVGTDPFWPVRGKRQWNDTAVASSSSL